MPASINPIRKAKVKKSLLEGKSIRQALSDGGYAPATQRGNNNSTKNRLVKTCITEIQQSLRAANITPDWLLKRFDTTQAAAFKTKDFSTALAADIAIAKFVAQIAEKHDIQFSDEEKSEFSRIRNLIQVNITTNGNPAPRREEAKTEAISDDKV